MRQEEEISEHTIVVVLVGVAFLFSPYISLFIVLLVVVVIVVPVVVVVVEVFLLSLSQSNL